jgi:hypothetical protein
MIVYGKVKIELDNEEEKRVARATLLRTLQSKSLYDWSDNHYIADDRVYVEHQYATTHSWTEDTFLRDATETDRLLEKIFAEL